MKKSSTANRLTQLVFTARFLIARHMGGLSVPLEPQFDPEALQRFEECLKKSRSYLEFGCGGSTIRAAKLGIRTLSVESDPAFAQAMRKALGPSPSVEIVPVDIGITRDWGWPLFTRRTASRLARWSRYSSVPWDRFPGGVFPDFILVDGRFRRACALQAAKHAAVVGRKTTIMFDDYYNAGREDYHSVERVLGTPRRVGRAAFFELDGRKAANFIDERELVEASADPW